MRISSFFPAPHLTFYIFLILIEAWNISKEGVEILELLKENCHKKILFSDKNCDERSGESRILDRKIDRLGKQEKCKTLFAKHSFKDTESKLAWTLQTYFKWALKTSRVCFFRDRAPLRVKAEVTEDQMLTVFSQIQSIVFLENGGIFTLISLEITSWNLSGTEQNRPNIN